MTDVWRTTVWHQFGAAIDMLENAITACPEELWGDRSREPQFWYLAFHTLWWLDYYLAGKSEGFAPPPPFGMEELDPAGVLPDRVYTMAEMLDYLEHGRRKCRTVLEHLTADSAAARCGFERRAMSIGELLLYNMRHVQHHAAQLNLLLRQNVNDAPRWVGQARGELGEA